MQSTASYALTWEECDVVQLCNQVVASVSFSRRSDNQFLFNRVMIGYVAGAIIQILQYLSSAEQLKMFTLWSMGSLGHNDAQSIYSFRGADIDNILYFTKIYPDTKVFKLEQNYRSTQTIVCAANSLIEKNERQIRKAVFSEKRTVPDSIN